MFVGIALVLISLVRISAPVSTAPMSLINIVLGIWLIVAPFALNYDYGDADSAATWNDIVVGAIVILLAFASWALSRRGRGAATADRFGDDR